MFVDATRLVTTAFQRESAVWDLSTGKATIRVPVYGYVLAVSPEASRVALGSLGSLIAFDPKAATRARLAG